MNRNNIFKLLTALILVCYAFQSNGQDSTIGHITIASPTAASLGKYGDIPVSYNTGIPNIGIPIYTVESGSLKLPISLSYHAGGLKVQEQASWVGAGWSLNAGGVITRTVIGAPDDRGIDGAHTTYGYFADYGINSYLFTAGGGYCGGSAPPCPIGSTVPADDVSVEAGVKDGEPDLYFFNFGGYTGKFYFNDDRTPIIVPEQDFNIVPIYPSGTLVSPIGIYGFIITTPDGQKYYFGKNSNTDGNIDATELTTYISATSPGNTGQGAASSWFLNKIISADGMDSINLSYAQDKYSYYTLSMFPVTPTASGIWATNNEYDLVKDFINGVRLNKITFPNGEVDFSNGVIRSDLDDYNSIVIGEVANTHAASLGAITIKNNTGFCKKDSFYFSYMHDVTSPLNGFIATSPAINTITSDTYRLRLDSMQEISCDASLKVPPYKFSYFSELVPRKLSFGIDHWGFYNGVTNNQTLIPSYIITSGNTPTFYTGADRDSHWPAMRGGALQQIKYPTGGYTQFNFEANDTYCSYSTYTKNSVGFSAGYDGGSTSTSSYTSGTLADMHMFIFSSNSTNPSSYASIQFGNVGAFYIAAGATDTFYVNLPENTAYTITTTFNYPLTGQGISGTITDFIPTAVSGNLTVGGLRIKTITNNDGVTPNNVITSYAYNYGGTQSSGILYSRPSYVQVLRNDILKQVGMAFLGHTCSINGCATCDAGTSQLYYKSPCSIRPMETSQGNHIGYNQVQVSQTNNGYSIYRYYGSNMWDYNISDVAIRAINISSCNTSVPNFPSAPLPFEYMRGELKYEGHFDNIGHILKDVSYFPKYIQDSIFTPGLIVQSVSTGGESGVFWGTEYSLVSASKIKDSVISTLYDPATNSYVSTTNSTYYNSPFHHRASRKVTTTSTGDSLVTNLKYAADFRIVNCDTISTGWHSYFSAYTTDSLSFYSTIGTCTSGSWNCKWVAYQQYRFNRSVDRKNYITLRQTNYTDSSNRFSSCHLNALPSADTLLKPILRLQNMYYNAPIESSEWKDLNLLHASYTRFDTSTSPLGFVYPARTKLINLQATSTTFTNASVSGTTISKDNRYVDESFYTFNNGNPIQVTPRDGIANSYIWDYLNSEPIAKASNAPVSQIAYTSFEADGKGNWTFTGTTVTDATSPTGGKCYSLASGNIVKPGLTSAKSIVSFWQKAGASVSVTGGSNASVTGKTINGWTYYEYTVTGATTITVSGSGYIDELRLYPSNAQMVTYTYTPLLGMTSACDVDNKITYYFYDGFGRLKWIKDQDLNIIKTIQYHYQTISGLQY